VFWWRTSQPIPDDVVFSWFVVSKDGSHPPIQALDSQAQGGFMPTTRWQAGQIIRDRRALSLPTDLPAGDYEVWVLAYRFVNGAPQRLTVFGSQTLPDNIGLLPITFQISTP
jgi:mannosyltransferase